MLSDYVHYAIIAYMEEAQIKEKICSTARFFDAHHFTEGESDAQFYAVIQKDELVLSLRGSSSWEDVKTDIDVRRVPFFSGLVHSGFLKQYQSIESIILQLVKETHVQTITCVGHSLGGALATLCALSVKNRFPEKYIQCISFGSPRVGNQAFAQEFDCKVDKSVRVVNGQDIVTTRPYWGYAHVKGLRAVGDPYTIWKYWGSIEDHRTDKYVQSCLALLTSQ